MNSALLSSPNHSRFRGSNFRLPYDEQENLLIFPWFCPFFSGELSQAELMVMTIADIIQQLLEAHEQGKDVDLNK